MRIFVTGGTKGFIASHLILKLRGLNHDVVIDWRHFNDRFDAIVHTAAKTHLKTSFDADLIESNYILAHKIFQRPERIIALSSCSAAYPETSPYAMSKVWLEDLAMKHGNAVALRLQNVYGPGNNKGIVWFLMNCIDGQRIKIRGPELVRDYIHVDDVVNHIIKPHLLPDGRCVDLRDLRKEIDNEGGDLKELIKKSFDGRRKHIDMPATKGVFDVGTGVATETIDLVNLYMKLSGKSFIIDVEEAGSNEPKSMVAKKSVGKISLRDGLTKMINNE